MKIKMLVHVNGKVNGERMGPYVKGHEYDLEQDRADLFIGSAMAEEVIPPPPVVEPDPVPDATPAPEATPEHDAEPIIRRGRRNP